MKLIIEINDNRIPFFMELLRSLNFISDIQEVKNENQTQLVNDLIDSFNDVRLHEKGEKKLKLASDMLNEL